MKYDYELDDDAIFYFVVDKDAHVYSWSDDKKLIDVYMKFHNCPKMKVKKVNMVYRSLVPVLNEHIHKEIIIAPLITRDKKNRVTTMPCPVTKEGLEIIQDYTDTFMSIVVDYSILSDVMKTVKKKYRDALYMFNLDMFIESEIYHKTHQWIEHLQIDQVRLFVRTFADTFG